MNYEQKKILFILLSVILLIGGFAGLKLFYRKVDMETVQVLKEDGQTMTIHTYAKQGNIEGVAGQLSKGVDVDVKYDVDAINIIYDKYIFSGFTPLMFAVTSKQADINMVRFLVEKGADVNAVEPRFGNNVLSVAAKAGDLEKLSFLLESGANVNYITPHGYDVLIHAMYGRDITKDENLIPILKLLIEKGVNVDTITQNSESAVMVASRMGRFDAVKVLLEAGADPEQLQWNGLMNVVVFGDVNDVEKVLNNAPDLSEKDSWERTAWLLSLQVGDIEKSKRLLSAGADRNDRGRCGMGPLMYPIINGHVELLKWLLDEGFDPDATDEFKNTPLIEAAVSGATECVKVLLQYGAKPGGVDKYGEKAISETDNVEIVRLLMNAGEDLSDASTQVRRTICGLSNDAELTVSKEDYLAGKHRRFGTSNPEIMNIPFWKAMIRCGYCAWGARDTFGDTDNYSDGPVWCFDRYGKSITELPDGRIVEIAGEHEDSYDPDFCIYNDVVVYYGDGAFDVYGYPREVFPPTDFHSATLVGEYIYIIGSLGYSNERQPGQTPVYRLHIETFKIEKIDTTGENPGWISCHKARLKNNSAIHVTCGKICKKVNKKESIVQNTAEYILNLTDMKWTRGKI